MKDSGVKWIGKIPDDWSVAKSKYVCKTYTGNSIKDEEKDLYTDSIDSDTYVATKNIDALTGKLFLEDVLYVKKKDKHFSRAFPGDTLMCIEGGSAGKKKTYLSNTFCFVNKLCCFHPFSVDSKYLYYNLCSPHYENEFNLNLSGMIGGVTRGKLNNFYYPIPPKEIQKLISQNLDFKCTTIDSLISNETKQIEKLEEYKKAVITKAVTKGLDPNAKMKDSGVKWIGKIKQDYHCEKLKFLLSSPMLYGANESGGKQEKGCTRFIRITDIDSNGNLKDTNDNQYLSASKSTGYILKNKDILFARSGGTVGKSFLYKNPGFPCSFAGYLIKAECEETLLLPEFLYYYTKSSLYEIWKNMIFVQSTIQNIGAQRYGNLDIVIPSIAEQKQIVQYIDKKCMLIDKLIDIKNRTRKQLIDFKKSLIYEYVTGKKRVSL